MKFNKNASVWQKVTQSFVDTINNTILTQQSIREGIPSTLSLSTSSDIWGDRCCARERFWVLLELPALLIAFNVDLASAGVFFLFVLWFFLLLILLPQKARIKERSKATNKDTQPERTSDGKSQLRGLPTERVDREDFRQKESTERTSDRKSRPRGLPTERVNRKDFWQSETNNSSNKDIEHNSSKHHQSLPKGKIEIRKRSNKINKKGRIRNKKKVRDL